MGVPPQRTEDGAGSLPLTAVSTGFWLAGPLDCAMAGTAAAVPTATAAAASAPLIVHLLMYRNVMPFARRAGPVPTLPAQPGLWSSEGPRPLRGRKASALHSV